jgi:signal transduction histidine kinase
VSILCSVRTADEILAGRPVSRNQGALALKVQASDDWPREKKRHHRCKTLQCGWERGDFAASSIVSHRMVRLVLWETVKMRLLRQNVRRTWSGLVLLLLVSLGVDAAEPLQVLLINSFGREFAPLDAFAGNFRTELVRRSAQPLDIYEVWLESARMEGSLQERPFADYISALFEARSLDLVVAVGGPAVRFAQKHRPNLFRAAPLLLAGVDERHLEATALGANDVVVSVRNEPVKILEDILRILPQTTNVCVVVGSSPLERFWRAELAREFQPFTNRLTFEWFDDLSFEEIRRRCGVLPPRCAIFYVLLAVDAEGVPFTEVRAFGELREVASAPMFGLHDTQLGHGIVGGSVMAIGELSRNTASIAARLLRGEEPASIRVPPQRPGRPQFDWRELRRWGIRESSLPRGSSIHFRQATAWKRYRWTIVGGASLFLLQASLILGLLLNRAKRLGAESAARTLSRKLLRAHEEERARVGRELHDDLTQRVARMAMDVSCVERSGGRERAAETLRSVHAGLVGLSADIHALSYRLHPSILEDLGFDAALKTECERFSLRESIPVHVSVQDVPPVASDTALNLFRVAQESLRNVARHARASSVRVSVHAVNGGLQLVVSDDGIGMTRNASDHPSLGLASMRERVMLLGGEFEIDSISGEGTTIFAWVPLQQVQP